MIKEQYNWDGIKWEQEQDVAIARLVRQVKASGGWYGLGGR